MRKFFLKLLLVIIVSITITNSANAQSMLRGSVRDNENNAISDVFVTIVDINITTNTDSNGIFIFSNIPAGKYIMTFRKIGFETSSLNINLSNRDTIIAMTLNESLIETPVINVTGSFSAEDISKSTFSITEINSKNITRQRTETLSGTIQNLPGVNNISTGSGIGKPVIRGLSSQSVLIIHDDVKHESQMWGDEHGTELSLFNIDRIEILRGPASIIYGADGIGGVVNVISKPMEFSSGKNNILYGETNIENFTVNKMMTGNLMIGFGTEKTGIKSHFGYRSAGDITTPDGSLAVNTLSGIKLIKGGRLFNSGFKELQAGIDIGLKIRSGLLSIGTEFFDRNIRLHKDPAVEPDATPNQRIKTYQLSLEGDFRLNKYTKIEPVISYQVQDRKEFESKEKTEAGQEVIHLNVHTIESKFKLGHRLTKQISGTAGVSLTFLNNNSLAEEKLIPNYSSYTAGAYLLEKFEHKLFTVSAGARFDYMNLDIKNTEFDSSNILNAQKILFRTFSGSFGIVHSPSKYFNIFANIGRGWRAPSVFELFVDGVHEGTGRYDKGLLTQDPEYIPKPEESLNIDAGLRFNFSKLNIQLSGYRNHITNFVYPEPDNDTLEGYPVFNIRQHKSLFTGFEYIIQYQPLKWFVISLSGDYVKTMNEATNEPLPLIPPMKNIAEVKLQDNSLGFLRNPYIMLNAKFVSAQENVSSLEVPSPAYTIFSAGSGFDLMLNKQVISVDLSILNLTNKKYADHLSRYKSFAMNPGRSFNLRLTIPFRF